jgi:hypothetical protein
MYDIVDPLDASIAAPQHHELLFENKIVSVLNANIPAGETTNVHTHFYPALLYFISRTDFITSDGETNVLPDSRPVKTPVNESSMWSNPLSAHTLKNMG